MVLALGIVPGPARAAGGDDMADRIAAAQAAPASSETRPPARRIGPAAPANGPAHLVVGYRAGTSATAMAGHLRATGVSVRADASLASLGAQAVTVPAADLAEVTAALRADPRVAYVEADAVVQATALTPNDPLYPQQTELPQITVPDAWSTTTGSAVTVAVIDTGVSPVGDLAGAVVPGWDFVNNDADPSDDQGHGTAVASLIAGRGNDGVGMAGVCWSCKVLAVKTLDATGSGLASASAAGIVFAADKGVKIINVSLGGYTATQVEKDAVAYAQSKGALVIASAGNDLVADKLYPAAFDGVLAVGGTDEDSEPYIFCWLWCEGTNYGPDWVDVAAPWCSIAANLPGYSTPETDDDYDVFCGTSGSAPLVSGVTALLKSKSPGATSAALTQALTSTARPTQTTGFTQFGEIRAAAALSRVDASAPKITGVAPGPNARFRGTVTVTATGVSDTGSGVAYAALYAGGKLVGRDTTAPYAVKYNSGKSNGPVAFQWRVVDRAGNSAVFNRTLIADNKAPTVKITSGPKNGAKVKGTVTVKVSAGDTAGINRVELLINGKVVAKDVSAAYAFKIKVSKFPKTMKIQIRAVDKVGNTAVTTVRTWKR
ncbi:S8 family serine peptidase [Actinoplanes sichuanensis]|uniref:S8 family serine peptidase n=1 Tax=Actinoplanes sichuanensis TaxID=512349 RepID=A0ABW4A0P5_9ACTN|nr:S8 family serine peptidase [Actinoplanes sichuanensis]